MRTITVSKEQLIRTLRENREKHQELFDKAQVVYREQMVEELDRALQEARDGGKIVRAFTLPVPENHTDEFDTAINMLTWDNSDTVELSVQEFRTYVENEWGWQQSFHANTEVYAASYGE